MRGSQLVNLIEAEGRMLVGRGWGGGNEELLSAGRKFWLHNMKKFKSSAVHHFAYQ